MSIALVQDCYREARRLAIAGSGLAVDDFRLRRLVGPLEKAGEKSPVFGKLAGAVKGVVDGDEPGASVALLELGTLAGAILYTQGKTGAEGELAVPDGQAVSTLKTDTSARVLAPLVEALTSTGSGRMEIVEQAQARGTFHDFRLLMPAIGALNDVYGELADFVGEKVLPEYGTRIVPLLEADLNWKGGARKDARRLEAIHRIDPARGTEIALKILDEGSDTEGSKEMKVAAIGCLAGSKEHLSELLGLSRAKNKEVREAAFRAMAKTPVRSVIARLKEAILGSDARMATELVGEIGDAELSGAVVGEARRVWEETKGGKANLGRLHTLVEGLNPESDREADVLLEEMVRDGEVLTKVKSKSYPGGEDVLEAAFRKIAGSGSGAGKRLLEAAGDEFPDLGFPFYFGMAVDLWKPKRLFKVFGPLVSASFSNREKREKREKWRRETVVRMLSDASETAGCVLDAGWFGVAVRAGEESLALDLLEGRKMGRDELKFLERVAEKGGTVNATRAIYFLGVAESKKVVGLIDKFLKREKAHLYGISSAVSKLPGSYLKEVEKWVSGLDEKVADYLLEAVETLREKTKKS